MGIEVIADLIPIHLHLQKLSSRNQLQLATLSYNHVIKLLLERKHTLNSQLHHLALENMMSKQKIKIKSFIFNMNNQLNGIFTSFDSLNLEFYPDNRLINIFYNCISLHNADRSSNKSKKDYCEKLDNIILKLSSDSKTVIIIMDASNKNNDVSSIAHIHSFNNSLKKTLYHTVNIT